LRVFSRAVGAVSRPCEKTACIQDLNVDCFLWRFFRKGSSANEIIEVGIKEGNIFLGFSKTNGSGWVCHVMRLKVSLRN